MPSAGDFEELIVRLVADHQTALRGYVMAMMPGSPDVDDVVQDVNVLVWRKRAEYEPGTDFKAWILTVAKFQVMGAWRDQKRRKESVLPEEVLVKLLDEGVEASRSAKVPRHEVLWECLETLRPADRGLILRRYFDGRPIKNLAGELGRGADSVKMSLHRIRSALAQCVTRRLKPGGIFT
jgi:RNA polymerase sigma-70 factor (ECF subfamily)